MLNSDQIQEIIPHRPPFLLVDKIIDMEEGKWATGIKCVTSGEAYFRGHFPGKQIMPGVLIVEALAQTGAVALMSMAENKGKLAVFGGIKNFRFRGMVVPGDTLELHCQLTAFRGNVGFGNAIAKVDNKIVAEGDISFVIVDK